ncbi:MAG TPA: uroporphyrinogen decarboxylase family protein [Terracidiphilus sp.]|nr:uroporphyrinogen decarboxylase family protein [Terracidiphilus sp.]
MLTGTAKSRNRELDSFLNQHRGEINLGSRSFYLDLAAGGLRMPIAADLVLNEEREPEKVRRNGSALGRVIELAARRWNSPLAISLMDLRLEKRDLLAALGIPTAEAERFHFTAPLDESVLAAACSNRAAGFCPESRARDEALSYVASREDLIPIGISIGPFSLATRLMADPISVIAMAGTGVEPHLSDEVRLWWQCLRISEAAVARSLRSQLAHGAKSVLICEPAAGTSFISPRQIRAGSKLFEQMVMEPNLRLKATLDEAGCSLIFHDCGELAGTMVAAFAQRLHPAVLSLGGSRKLWEDARLVPKDVVLYGNLPSKSFYSDAAMPVKEVARLTRELVAKMRACGHPHIVGTECDVLFVPGAQETIREKVHAMMAA